MYFISMNAAYTSKADSPFSLLFCISPLSDAHTFYTSPWLYITFVHCVSNSFMYLRISLSYLD